jgi:outer membrane protein assembly factor BamD
MKIINFTTVLVLALLLFGCATESKSGIDAFKNQAAKQIYDGGMQALSKKNYNAAVQHFEALDTLYPFGEYAESGLINLVYAYYKNGDYAAAAAVAERYIHLYPTSSRVDYAYYLRAMANFEKDKTWLSNIYVRDPAARDLSSLQTAFVNFSELVTQFPKSKYAHDARDRMLYIRNLIAGHELQVANFYLQHKAYVAAANRAAYIVEHFEGTPQVVEALKIMIKSYSALGNIKEANDALKVLRHNYPNVKI